jgi:hypothetical protein
MTSSVRRSILVRACVVLGVATTIPVYDLDGTVRAFGADGVRAIIEAGRHPLTGDELAVASADDASSRLQRQFFRSLDVIATALTTVATGGGQTNSYPNGCGDPLARPA